MEQPKPTSSGDGISSRITKYFLKNPSVTLLFFMLLVFGGISSFFLLRASGFPGANINLITVSTVYPGASASAVEQKITKPIESAIKDIDGVGTITATSRNSVSVFVINLEDGSNPNDVQNKIRSAVETAGLPDTVETPKIDKPVISGDSFTYVLSGVQPVTEDETYQVLQTLKTEIEKDSGVASFSTPGDFVKTVKVEFDSQKLSENGLTTSDAINQIRAFGLQLPITESANIAGRSQSVSVSIPGGDINELSKLMLRSSTNVSATPTLGDVATIGNSYQTGNSDDKVAAYRKDDKPIITDATYFGIKLTDQQDVTVYAAKIDTLLSNYFGNSSQKGSLTQAQNALFSKYEVVRTYSEADQNKRQVDEIVAGMIGDNWNGTFFGNIGFVFGAIQLVFLLMLLLVSWRAAIIATLSIPLSFFFSTVVLLLTGNELNTLVLFTLVLVIGLVVDPALVVLEVIQRKIDAGMRGKIAVIAGVKEIGPGLLLTVLNSIIVFTPFGVVSGFFGEIIRYIPLTIIPALVGSYLVPLIFLTAIASRFLRPTTKKQSVSEIDNLWAPARWTMLFNRWLLNRRWFVQAPLILAALGIPLLVAGLFVGSGMVKVTQFAQPEDSPNAVIDVIKNSQRTDEQRRDDSKALFRAIMQNPNVEVITPSQFGTGGNSPLQATYLLGLKENRDVTSSEIANQLNAALKTPEVSSRFYDLTASLSASGPPNEVFPVAIALKNVGDSNQNDRASELSDILYKICEVDGEYKYATSCATPTITKVNNGLGTLSARTVEIIVKKDSNLPPVQPLALQQVLSQVYGDAGGVSPQAGPAITVNDGSSDIELEFKTNGTKPSTIEDIKNIQVPTLTGQQVPLSDIADVSEIPAAASLTRVNGENILLITAKPKSDYTEQIAVAGIQSAAISEFNTRQTSVPKSDRVVAETYSEGTSASIVKSFSELGVALGIAIALAYLIQVIFFKSLLEPLVVLFTIPLAFLGMFPALAFLAGGQLGLFEIIGFIILIGLVVNVAIFLMSLANQKVQNGEDRKQAIVEASGIRFRPIILTKLTVLISLAPLAVLSEDYRALAVVVMFGLLTSGIVSLFVVPSLYMLVTTRRRPSFGNLGRLIKG